MAAAPNKPKTVVVCGDLIWDTNISLLPPDPRGYFRPHATEQLTNFHGGAWYLRDIVKRALTAAAIPADVVAPRPVRHLEIEEGRGYSLGVARGFSLWEWFIEDAKSDPPRGTWRIKEFLGCQEPRWEDRDAATGKDSRAAPPLEIASRAIDLLVIDDLGLGFVRHPACWPAFLPGSAARRRAGRSGHAPADAVPDRIVARATPPFDSALWGRLLAEPWASRLTLIVSAAALRIDGARLSRGLSWDRTIDEVKGEFREGGTAWPLRRCRRVIVCFGESGAAVFSRVRLAPRGAEPRTLRFERFVYDPLHLEDSWSAGIPGKVYGVASSMTAAFAAHVLADHEPSSHRTVSRGLQASRHILREGAGHAHDEFTLGAGEPTMFELPSGKHDPLPEQRFRSAFPRELLDPPALMRRRQLPPLDQQTLLTDVLGLTQEFLMVAAEQIVRYGKGKPLRSVPRVEYGRYFTVDRDEIERLNAVRNLVLDYRHNASDRRPLSLAVFGPPGSGKSFAIKELAEALFGREQAVLEFNLSQFPDLAALHEAFHVVRDQSIKNQVPFVFWDEFDSPRNGNLGWLKEFLVPMQDAHFVANGREHPFGKCIFVFAGGTSRTFEDFAAPMGTARGRPKGALNRIQFEGVKGPDFVSRLRGFVNIKGPNPTAGQGDEVHILRRALLLRSLIERHHRGALDPATQELSISPTVLRAFLRVGDGHAGRGYLHGARSMEALVSLSRLHGRRQFGPSELPAPDVLELHVEPDFRLKLEDRSRYHLTPADVDHLGRLIYQSYNRSRGIRDATPYEQLPDEIRDMNGRPAVLAALRLEALGYDMVPGDVASRRVVTSPKALPLRRLAISEHRRWMREKLIAGMAWGNPRDDGGLRNAWLCRFASLPKATRELDDANILAIFEFIEERGLKLVRRSPARR